MAQLVQSLNQRHHKAISGNWLVVFEAWQSICSVWFFGLTSGNQSLLSANSHRCLLEWHQRSCKDYIIDKNKRDFMKIFWSLDIRSWVGWKLWNVKPPSEQMPLDFKVDRVLGIGIIFSDFWVMSLNQLVMERWLIVFNPRKFRIPLNDTLQMSTSNAVTIATHRDCLLRYRVFYSFSSPGELSKKSLPWLQLHSKKVKTPLAISVWTSQPCFLGNRKVRDNYFDLCQEKFTIP